MNCFNDVMGAVAFVGYDMVKVWPLPVVSPWFEDSTVPPGWQQADIGLFVAES